ncbi:hypothetical protein LTS18_011640 [Coniosporium uncinatum]|uniref:Uncharacterized protein n=1 Tax=Coniosporium uncinatum TaxID=93489 RepID=A0ACC3D9D4_9PEZI|nr:hypothetical protein LTS18_011640 [Coniosporium uncinatum]
MDVKDTTKDAVVSPVTADVPRDEAVLEAVGAEKSLGFVAAFPHLQIEDPQLLGNLYATPAFQGDTGYEYEGEYTISAAWQSGLSMGNPVGQCVGALLAGYPMEWFGRRKTFAACVFGTCCCVFFQFFARSLEVLLTGELLGGLVLGAYVAIAPAYASEVCPMTLRGQLTSYINLCVVMGQLLANGVTAGTSKLSSHWAYGTPLALQWFWILVIILDLPFAPESPWWLVRNGRKVDVKATLAVIVETDRLEQAMEAGSSYLDCFHKANWRRTEISVGVCCTQVLSGIYLVNYATYFFQQAGLPTERAFDMGIGFLAVGFLGTVTSWFLLLHFGRRALFTSGLALLAVLQLVIGIPDCVPGRPTAVIWTQSSLMVVWNFFTTSQLDQSVS